MKIMWNRNYNVKGRTLLGIVGFTALVTSAVGCVGDRAGAEAVKPIARNASYLEGLSDGVRLVTDKMMDVWGREKQDQRLPGNLVSGKPYDEFQRAIGDLKVFD